MCRIVAVIEPLDKAFADVGAVKSKRVGVSY